MQLASRSAKVGDKLETRNFGTGTVGFCDPAEPNVAVCVLPGTEIAFDKPFTTGTSGWVMSGTVKEYSATAVFRQINKESPCTHHDALEADDGQVILLTQLTCGQKATVLQLPAEPKTEAEAQEQARLEVVA